MEKGCSTCTNDTETAHSVQLLKINGFSTTGTMTKADYIECSWDVDGFEWEVRLYPSFRIGCDWVALKFIFLGGARAARAEVRCRLVDPSGNLEPSEGKCMSKEFAHPGPGGSEFMLLIKVRDALVSDYLLDDDSLTVECSITVLKELKRITIPAKKAAPARHPAIPPSDLHQHLGELLRSQKGADVAFAVAGETFRAHKLVLAARSPVFMAEFVGGMAEGSSESVELVDMETAAFRAMLRFIYTDAAPELEDEEEPPAATAMAQHLLAAADRYGLERLKLICEARLCDGVDVDTAATTLALAHQHNCKLLKANCVEFITGSTETFDAVLATEGYNHLVASGPLVLTQLFKAAYERMI